jgi:group I intron endonuclease
MKENKISGVYKITNNVTGDFYVGSSKNIMRRWTQHRYCSEWKKQPNSRLYQAMSHYGKDNFTIETIEETDNLKEREQYWIEQLKPTYNSIRADGQDTERYKAWHKVHYDERLAQNKAYYWAHQDEILAYSKAWHQAHQAEQKAYQSKPCLYEGETLTLGALRSRFSRQGIPHPTIEAKKYLI